MWWRREFRAEPAEVSVARAFVAALLPEQPIREDIVTCASELAANAVVHGRGSFFSVEVRLAPSWLRLSVADEGGRAFSTPAIAADMAEDGRGLAIVRALCRRLEVIGDARGRIVRAEFAASAVEAISPRSAAASGSSHLRPAEPWPGKEDFPGVAVDELVGSW